MAESNIGSIYRLRKAQSSGGERHIGGHGKNENKSVLGRRKLSTYPF